MEPLIWDESYATGLAEIDSQHRDLFALVNALGESLASGAPQEDVIRAVDRMNSYARNHFAAEEHFIGLLPAHCAHVKAHLAQHSEFRGRVVDFLYGIVNEGGEITPDVLKYLREWLVGHVLATDRKLVAELRRAGILREEG